MEEQAIEKTRLDDRKKKTLVLGAVLGVCVGLAAAYVYMQKFQDETQPAITASDGVKLGVLVVGLLRNIANLGEVK